MHLIKSYMAQEFWKLNNSFQKGYKEKNYLFYRLVDFLYPLNLKICQLV